MESCRGYNYMETKLQLLWIYGLLGHPPTFAAVIYSCCGVWRMLTGSAQAKHVFFCSTLLWMYCVGYWKSNRQLKRVWDWDYKFSPRVTTTSVWDWEYNFSLRPSLIPRCSKNQRSAWYPPFVLLLGNLETTVILHNRKLLDYRSHTKLIQIVYMKLKSVPGRGQACFCR